MRKCPRHLLCFQWLWWNQLLWFQYCQHRCRAWLRMIRILCLLLKVIHSVKSWLCSNHCTDPNCRQYFPLLFVSGRELMFVSRMCQLKSYIDNSGSFEAGTDSQSVRHIVQCQRITTLDFNWSSCLLLFCRHTAVLGTVHTKIQQFLNCWNRHQNSLRQSLNLQHRYRWNTSKSMEYLNL